MGGLFTKEGEKIGSLPPGVKVGIDKVGVACIDYGGKQAGGVFFGKQGEVLMDAQGKQFGQQLALQDRRSGRAGKQQLPHPLSVQKLHPLL